MSAVYAEPATAPATSGTAIDPDVKKKITRGRSRMQQGAPLANECIRFWRNDQYVYRSGAAYSTGQLQSQPTLYGSDGLDAHRMRTTRNMILDVVAQETSASTQRVPGYDVTPSTTDNADIAAAALAKKVADYGYDKWRIRNATVRLVEYATIQGEGFAWPFFDNTIGQPIGDTGVCIGDVNIRVYGRNQVMWEPRVLFEDSRWHAVEYAEPIDRVKAMPGFLGGELKADSTAGDGSITDAAATNLVRVTHYLERPSAEYQQGRHIVTANERQILPEAFYPCVRKDKNGEDEYVDEPALLKLSYFLDPESERDMGLVEHLLDSQRTINDCTNKQLEWKNHALIPQILAPVGSIRTKRTDKPGAIIDYIPINGVVPQWQPVPPVPPELSAMKAEAKQDISIIAAQTSIPNQVASGDAITALIEKDANRRQEFIARLAEFHSRLMRYCLYLVQQHYTTPMLLMIRGEFGVEPLDDFLGAHLRGQADVTVLPDSIAPKTREQIAAQVMGYADRGWITPEKAMAAIAAGTAGGLIQSYQRDEARAYLVIRKIRAFGTVSGDIPEPRPFDNLDVQAAIIEDYMKSDVYDSDPPPVQEAAMLYWQAIQQLKSQKAAQDAQVQAQAAEAAGMLNAARPQAPGGGAPPKPMPSPPSSSGPSA